MIIDQWDHDVEQASDMDDIPEDPIRIISCLAAVIVVIVAIGLWIIL